MNIRNKKGQFKKGMTFVMSEEHKRKIGEAHKGKKREPFSKEWRKNISKSLKGNKRHWKGGKTKHRNRWYIRNPNHPRAWLNGYVLQSVLLMEKKLRRLITKKEVIHHINRNTLDDSLENLFLMRNQSQHRNYHKNCETTYSNWLK